jgi:hypothetical protein
MDSAKSALDVAVLTAAARLHVPVTARQFKLIALPDVVAPGAEFCCAIARIFSN